MSKSNFRLNLVSSLLKFVSLFVYLKYKKMHTLPSIIESFQDITIEKIDFDWIKSCVKIPYLRRAIRVIEQDGDYYPDLKDACFKRLEELDPSLKKQIFNNKITGETKNLIQQELIDWENEMDKNPINNAPPIKYNDHINAEQYFDKHPTKITIQQRIKLAEVQRNKGNQAMKSKDFDQAISFYNKSLEMDNKEAATYCNRALAFLRKNEYDKVIKDCTDCLCLNPKYTKAFHRRSKAYLGLKLRVKAYYDLKEAQVIEPNNNQINGQLKELRDQMTKQELSEVDSLASKQFKRIQIEEESEEEGQNLEQLS